MSTAHPKPTPTHAHAVPVHHATAAVPHHPVNDTLSVFGVGVSQGKLIAVFLVLGILLMVLRRRLTQHKRYVPSNPPKDYSSVSA